MPEASFAGAGMLPQLLSQGVCGLEIFLFSRYFIQQQQGTSGCDVVYIVFVSLVSADVAIVVNKKIHALLYVSKIFPLTGCLPNSLDPLQDHSLVIGPFGRLTCFE